MNRYGVITTQGELHNITAASVEYNSDADQLEFKDDAGKKTAVFRYWHGWFLKDDGMVVTGTALPSWQNHSMYPSGGQL